MKRRNNHTAFYKFLNPFLEKGDELEIARAKKEYFRQYKARWRKEKRKIDKEIMTSWAHDELKSLTVEAKRHNISRCRFIKQATIAYVNKRYIVPDVIAVRSLLQTLAMQYNLIETLILESELSRITGKELLEKLDDQEKAIRVALYSPTTLKQLITEAVRKDNRVKADILNLLQTFTHDP